MWVVDKGDVSKFPEKVEVIMGPGVKEAYLPGYPARKDSPLLESDFKYASTVYFFYCLLVSRLFRVLLRYSFKKRHILLFHKKKPKGCPSFVREAFFHSRNNSMCH